MIAFVIMEIIMQILLQQYYLLPYSENTHRREKDPRWLFGFYQRRKYVGSKAIESNPVNWRQVVQ